ncbi:MAG TPA: metallopeptidase TldD-related protein [Actinospica sp.]|nr:metallopeptidase TldD-related protein [Actinospica sp.]
MSVTPQRLAELALAAAKADGTVVLVEESSTANLRWANNTLTTNGVAANRRVSVVSTLRSGEGVSAATVSKAGVTEENIEELVRESEAAARAAGPAPDARPLLGPGDAAALQGLRWEEAAVGTDIEVFTGLAPALGESFEAARSAGQLLFGFAEHTAVTTYLATSTGLRLRHDQPTGKLELNAKTPDFVRSAWGGAQTRDFADIDVVSLAAGLGQRLDWQKRRIELPAGRYETLLPPTAVADLMIYLYWTATARDAADGRTVFSAPGGNGGTKVGRRIGIPGLRLWSDPNAAGLEAAPFNTVTSSSGQASVFDNGLPLGSTDWVRDGVLERLLTTRHSAQETGLPLAAPIDNLLLDAGGSAGLEELTRSTEDGLLLTCLWYIREVDPQSLLLTGLTRDGVYKVEGGEVVGVVNNFRFNESPVDLLSRIAAAGRTEITLPREWNDYFTRTAMPALRISDFNMSSVSKAS